MQCDANKKRLKVSLESRQLDHGIEHGRDADGKVQTAWSSMANHPALCLCRESCLWPYLNAWLLKFSKCLSDYI